jgi:hypothetical protein
MEQESDSVYRVLIRRGFAAADPAKLQVHFSVEVLERYREAAAFSIVRTNSVGRVKKEGGWVLDFGIAPGEALLHASFGDIAALPEDEREHWSHHARALPASKMFLQMRLSPSACFDDGELRKW